MKEFNLDAALNGEPVMLRNGNKAFITFNLSNLKDWSNVTDRPLIGHSLNKSESLEDLHSWTLCGWSAVGSGLSDIIGMWEEPKKQISIEDLPKPFKPKDGEPFYYINGGCIEYKREYRYSNLFDKYAAENGNCFRTREGAEMWLKLMKGMLE